MRKKRVLIIGPGRSGKSTLAAILNDSKEQIKRMPNMVYGANTIDVPAGYLECPWMHCHIIAAAQDAFCILMLLEQKQSREWYPPGFAKVFQVPVIGVITKSDQNHEYRKACEKQLGRTGIEEPYFHVSLSDTESLDKLQQAIWNIKKGGDK